MSSPFHFGQVVKETQFVNRTDEIKCLSNNFSHGINTMLISPRRWGKTSLINEVARRWEDQSEGQKIVMIDLFRIRNEQEFYETLIERVVQETYSTVEQWMRFITQNVKQLRPKIELDPHSDIGFTVTMDTVDQKESKVEILDLAQRIAEEKDMQLVIALDEFQSIDHFEDPEGFQQLLRSVWQYHDRVSYCLYGSKKHMLEQYFRDASMPFYKFGELMELDLIEIVHWIPFLMGAFKKSDKKLPKQCARKIAELVKGHPYYVQQLAWIIWSSDQIEYDEGDILEGFEEQLMQNRVLFEREIEQLTNQQLNVLRVVANEEQQLSSQAVLTEYGINSSAQVYAALKKLRQEDLVDQGESGYTVLDPLLKEWIIRYFG
jgi:hypothetical protein